MTQANNFTNKKNGEFSIQQLANDNNLDQFTEFAINLYNSTSSKQKNWQPLSERQTAIMKMEDLAHFDYGHFFELLNEDKKTIGTAKITLKQDFFPFPLERHFGVDIKEACNYLGFEPDDIWHFGRLAIDSTKTNRSIKALNTLLYHSLSIASQKPNNIVVAECDAQVCRKLEIIGISAIKAGLPLDYIGSMTFPIIVTGENIREYLKTVKL